MGPEDDGRAPGVELLEAGPLGAGDRASRWPRWSRWLLAGLVAATATIVVVRENSRPSGPSGQSASPGRPGTSAATDSSTAPDPTLPPVVITEVGRPLLGVTAGWELFGRGQETVVRIQPARGRITRTTVPGLLSSGPISFLAGPSEAIVRPLDAVPGYMVPDGIPPRQISPRLRLGQSGPVFPGPDPNHVWVPNDGGPPAFSLIALDGAAGGMSIAIPPGASALDAVPDGAGYLLFRGTGGVYDARPDGLHRITTGALLAVGPSGWLTVDCDERAHCATVLIDRATDTRRVVGAAVTDGAGPYGLIAPDGRTAAMFELDPNGSTTRLYLLDLTTGLRHGVPVPIEQVGYDGTAVWSPDGRWLFAVGAGGEIDAVDPRTGRVTGLNGPGVSLPSLTQLAIRTAPTR